MVWGGDAAAQRSKWYRLRAAAAAHIENCVSGVVLCRLRPPDAIETAAVPVDPGVRKFWDCLCQVVFLLGLAFYIKFEA